MPNHQRGGASVKAAHVSFDDLDKGQQRGHGHSAALPGSVSTTGDRRMKSDASVAPTEPGGSTAV
ncbi:hypothetical protein B2J88_15385 [Rhodococcus sp. SRB_17]|nr:hypothetical protein [Rhodococcus sp. SRB_17]